MKNMNDTLLTEKLKTHRQVQDIGTLETYNFIMARVNRNASIMTEIEVYNYNYLINFWKMTEPNNRAISVLIEKF